MADSSMDLTDLQKMKVADLKKLLKEKGLPSSGNKPELILRLQQNGQENGAVSDVKSDDLDVSDDVLNDDLDDDPKEADVLTDPVVTSPSIEATDNGKSEATSVKAPATDEAGEGDAPSKDGTVAKTGLTETEKIAMRAKKFCVVSSEEAKKAIRAQRFGVTSPTSEASKTTEGSDSEKLKQRAGRFGTDETNKIMPAEMTDKLKKRAERFGTVTSTTLTKIESQEKLLKRKMRFGANTASSTEPDSEVEEKKKKRAERFLVEAK